jgi:hypothetical protein
VSKLRKDSIVAAKQVEKHGGEIIKENKADAVFLSVMRLARKDIFLPFREEFSPPGNNIYNTDAGIGLHRTEVFKKLF